MATILADPADVRGAGPLVRRISRAGYGRRIGEPVEMSGLFHGAQDSSEHGEAMFAAFRTEIRKEGHVMTTGSIEDAVAKQALRDLVATYARGVDRADEATLASVFHADAEIVTGIIDGKAPDYAREVVAMVRSNLRNVFHSVANEYFEVADDTAAGETYVIAHMITNADEAQRTITGGRYLDRFEKRDGVWKIAHRRFVTDWTMSRPVTLEETGLYEALSLRGGYAPADPSSAFWAAA